MRPKNLVQLERAFSFTQIYLNKRKLFHKKKVQVPQGIGWVHHNDRRFNSERATPCPVDLFFAIVRPMLSDQMYVIEMGVVALISKIVVSSI